jgi:hypothetical protein
MNSNSIKEYFRILKREQAVGTLENVWFPDGVGMYIALGCYRDSSPERCSQLLTKAKSHASKACGKHMIPSAFSIGTGFLVRSDSVDKTRRKSLINRLCNTPTKYLGFINEKMRNRLKSAAFFWID